ncbi:MAG: glycosyltransferase family 39 protein [Candidatus Omnitrophica bacterium]|nr:glycosyltransferase family 39 protein [Candidatus Omnitrophota bacterium]MCB9721742.1 glycosyltransferase family 39 protein [Candidatus Omnitrophota bacterium]
MTESPTVPPSASKERLNRWLIAIFLILLMAGTFIVRQRNIIDTQYRSIDEYVYHRMAVQVQWGWENYHTQPYGHILAEKGRDVPAYFFQPLYKHPPLFTMANLLSYQIFGITPMSPFYVALCCGLLMIPLVYHIGALVYNRLVGLAAAFIMAFDSIGIMVSQKMWMDSMIGLLAVTSIYAFIVAVQKSRGRYFITAGIISGFGALTKYTGAVGSVVMAAYALLFDRRLLRNKYFWMAMIIPLLMLIPWLIWNLQVFGWDYFGMQVGLHSSGSHAGKLKRNLLILAGLAVMGGVFLLRYYPGLKSRPQFWTNLRIGLGCATVLLLWESILKSFYVAHLPVTSWTGSTFYGASPAFYLNRLLEWNLIYFFALLALFLPTEELSAGEKILRLGFVLVLLIFTAWGAFQCRYIIAAVPLGILIGTNLLYDLWRNTELLESLPARIAGRSAIIVFVYMIMVRMLFINQHISYTNNMCYF